MSVSQKKYPSVLFITNSFSTGGVETHILSLAKMLKARGYFVAVASAGGSLEKELAANGILHIYLPLSARKLYNILLSYRLLFRAVKAYRFDILHAHSRLAAFVVSLLPKTMRQNFVTTAHLDFEVTPLTRFFSRWGEKTLAVSEDICAYLVREYALSYRQISLTVNGIDTELFCQNARSDKFCAKTILHVSRMDQDRAAVAFLLCDILPKLCQHGKVKLILVGGGELLPSLKKRVQEDAFLKEHVWVVGEAVDITPYLERADVFVGVSRAALEAMACGIPTILAGNSGYLGIFRSELLAKAASTNFCCRGECAATPSRLVYDLSHLLFADREELEAISSECRKTVVAHYSLDKMTNDYETFYASLTKLKKHSENLILGYHGFGNLGDDLLLENLLLCIRSIDPFGSISVISQNARKTARGFSVSAVSRKNPLAMLQALLHARVLYVGGGTLLQKDTSHRSLYYYAFWIRLAKLFGKRVVYYANGLGDFSEKDEKMLARLLSGNCVVTLRDRESYLLAKRAVAGMKDKPYLARTADSAMTLQALDKNEAACLFSAHGLPTDKPYFVLALSGRQQEDEIFSSLISAIRTACEAGYFPIFLTMQPQIDAPLAQRLAVKVQVKQAPIVTLPPRVALSLIAGAGFVITSRFHALLFGAMTNRATLCLSRSEKCRRFCREVGITPIDSAEELPRAVSLLFKQEGCFQANCEAVAKLTELAKTTPEKIREGFAYLADKTNDKTIERFKIKEGQKP